MRRGVLLAAAVIVSFLFAGCNKYYLAKGDREYQNLRYATAIDNYRKYLVKTDDPSVRLKIADACVKINHLREATEELEKVRLSKVVNEDYWLVQGRVLMEQGKYDSAETAFRKYLEKKPNDKEAENLCLSCSWIYSKMQDTGHYELRPIALEGLKNYFSATPYKNGIIFTANADKPGRYAKDPKNDEGYLNLYYTEKDNSGNWKTPTKVEGEASGYYHESCACVNPESDQLFFTRSESFDTKLKNTSEKDANLKIFFADMKDGAWKGLTAFPFNSEKYSVAQPAVSSKQKLFFFVSNQPGGAGGTDLYFSMMSGNGFTEPVNLGPSVNTPGNEMFPWYNEADSSLYFSSEGHNNFGGLDIFKVKIVDGKASTVENLGFPVNSSKDDYGYVMTSEAGYISSNRSGADKLYEVKVVPAKVTLTGSITTEHQTIPLADVTIEVTNKSTGEKKKYQSNGQGEYEIELTAGSDYRLYASKEQFYTSKPADVSTSGIKKPMSIVVDFDLEQIILEKVVLLPQVYYPAGKWNLMEEGKLALDIMAEILKANPEIAIEIGSHTDSRANDGFNLKLSERRAKEAVEYLVKKGIEPGRLSWKGYGETQLLNHCDNSTFCSDDEHSINRRTEFKVTQITRDIYSKK